MIPNDSGEHALVIWSNIFKFIPHFSVFQPPKQVLGRGLREKPKKFAQICDIPKRRAEEGIDWERERRSARPSSNPQSDESGQISARDNQRHNPSDCDRETSQT